jgi:hypothetical protein
MVTSAEKGKGWVGRGESDCLKATCFTKLDASMEKLEPWQ